MTHTISDHDAAIRAAQQRNADRSEWLNAQYDAIIANEDTAAGMRDEVVEAIKNGNAQDAGLIAMAAGTYSGIAAGHRAAVADFHRHIYPLNHDMYREYDVVIREHIDACVKARRAGRTIR